MKMVNFFIVPLIAVVAPPLWALAAQVGGNIAEGDTWQQTLTVIGSIGLGGYLVLWLTARAWPQAVVALNAGFDRVVQAIELRVVAKLDEIKNANADAHREQSDKLREMHADLERLSKERRQ